MSEPLVEKKMVRLMPNIVRITPPMIPTIFYSSIALFENWEFEKTYKMGVLANTASYQLFESFSYHGYTIWRSLVHFGNVWIKLNINLECLLLQVWVNKKNASLLVDNK